MSSERQISAGSRSLTRNSLWNLSGQIAPLAVAIFAIPLLVERLGTGRFGVLTLAWVVIGYFGLFDLGLNRALTRVVAERLGSEREGEIPDLIRTCLVLMFLAGVAGTLILVPMAPWSVRVLRIPEDLQAETQMTFFLLSLSLPAVVAGTGLRGVLEAFQRFDLVNIVRIPLGVFTFAGPLAVLPFSESLLPIAAVLVAGRILVCLIYLRFCRDVVSLRCLAPGTIRLSMAGPLLRFGGWMTVSNIIGPLMVYMDRFLLGTLVSMAAVTYYATPFEAATRVLVIPAALTGVLFPVFSNTITKDHRQTGLLYGRGVRYLFIALFPLTLTIVVLSHEGLLLWVGTEFAQQSTRVMQLLAVGVFLNSLAQIPFALIQGAGRPDITAGIHLAELPVYLLVLYGLIGSMGIEGAALAWLIRTGTDAALMFFVGRRFLGDRTEGAIRDLVIFPTVCIAFFLGAIISHPLEKALFLPVVLTGFMFAAWRLILTPEERASIGERIRPGLRAFRKAR